jgi:hypothetical protein
MSSVGDSIVPQSEDVLARLLVSESWWSHNCMEHMRDFAKQRRLLMLRLLMLHEFMDKVARFAFNRVRYSDTVAQVG